ncbi:MAG TPA: fumarylacetoacetase [Candidatus Limnocylindria bacterium]|nr:fumarylacetoacetase [Candidatus Limnocylindria bacterium]
MTDGSWVADAPGSGFGLENLPYGAFSTDGEGSRLGVRIGDSILDLGAAARAGLLDGTVDDPVAVLGAANLNPLLAHDPATWARVRARVADLLGDEANQAATAPHLVPCSAATMHLPFAPGDYVDFYSSIEHASTVGRIFRPDGDPLLPNWRWVPIAYHGRAGTVVPSGTPVHRPLGQRRPPRGEPPTFGPTEKLDIELELGFVVGGASRLGEPIPIGRAEEHLFGVVLVNDWSARDIQAWEYQPLGPFLGKSFATTVGAWVVPWAALAPYRVAARPQDPPPLPHLALPGEWALDIELRVDIAGAGAPAEEIVAVNARGLYWSAPQQLAHLTSNGATVRPGDLFASGTISGEGRAQAGSLLERTWNGRDPLRLASGVERTFLADGDTVTLRGWAGGDAGSRPRVDLGTCSGTILPAPAT